MKSFYPSVLNEKGAFECFGILNVWLAVILPFQLWHRACLHYAYTFNMRCRCFVVDTIAFGTEMCDFLHKRGPHIGAVFCDKTQSPRLHHQAQKISPLLRRGSDLSQ